MVCNCVESQLFLLNFVDITVAFVHHECICSEIHLHNLVYLIFGECKVVYM
jgi:hypothetical protein